jgi:hypothetical protein
LRDRAEKAQQGEDIIHNITDGMLYEEPPGKLLADLNTSNLCSSTLKK